VKKVVEGAGFGFLRIGIGVGWRARGGSRDAVRMFISDKDEG